jgi:hypothetical protein
MMKILFLMLLNLSFLLANIGNISAVSGDANIQREGKKINAFVGFKLQQKDIIHTASNGKVQLLFMDQTIITIGKNSALNIEDYVYDTRKPENSKTQFNFFKGAFKTITGQIGKINKEKFKLKTSSASIGIRGTIVLGNQSAIACLQGAIRVENKGVIVNVDANEFTNTSVNQQPTPAQTLKENTYNSLEGDIEPNEDEPQPQASSSGETSELSQLGKIEEVIENIENVNESNDEAQSEATQTILETTIDDTSKLLTFEGTVEGTISFSSSTENILQDASNKIVLDFDIGSGNTGNMTGEMQFGSSSVSSSSFSYDLSANAVKLNNKAFDVDAIHKTDSALGTQTFQMKGNKNQINSVNAFSINGAGGKTANITSITANKK